MMYRFCFIIVLAIVLVTFNSCRSKIKPEIKTNDHLRIQTKVLEGEKLPIDELIPSGVFVLDTFMIVVNRKETKMLKIYSAKTYQLLDTFLVKGRGPEEMQLLGTESGGFCENGEAKLWIKAFPNFIGLLNINRSLKTGKPVYDQMFNFLKDRRVGTLYTSNSIYHIGDSTFLLCKDPERLGVLKENPNPFYIKYNYASDRSFDTLYLGDYKHVKEFLPIKAGDGCVRPDGKKVVKTYMYMNQILISDLETQKQLWIAPMGYLSTIDEMSIDKREYYIGVCCTQNVFLASRAARYDNQGNIPERFLEVYDWDGNLLWCLKVKEAVWYPFIDEVNGYLYAVNEMDEIWRYDIRDILASPYSPQ